MSKIVLVSDHDERFRKKYYENELKPNGVKFISPPFPGDNKPKGEITFHDFASEILKNSDTPVFVDGLDDVGEALSYEDLETHMPCKATFDLWVDAITSRKHDLYIGIRYINTYIRVSQWRKYFPFYADPEVQFIYQMTHIYAKHPTFETSIKPLYLDREE